MSNYSDKVRLIGRILFRTQNYLSKKVRTLIHSGHTIHVSKPVIRYDHVRNAVRQVTLQMLMYTFLLYITIDFMCLHLQFLVRKSL